MPLYVTDVLIDQVQLTTANTATDNPGATGLGTFSLSGATLFYRVNYFRVIATGTTTAGKIRIFLSTNTGTSKRLIYELAVTAVTPSGSVVGFSGEIYPTEPLILPDGGTHILYCTTQNSETFNVSLFGGLQ